MFLNLKGQKPSHFREKNQTVGTVLTRYHMPTLLFGNFQLKRPILEMFRDIRWLSFLSVLWEKKVLLCLASLLV